LEDAGLDPLLEAVVGSRSWAKLGGVQRLPLAAGAEDEEDGLHANAIRGARAAAAEAVGVLVLGDQQGDGFPEVVGNAPCIGDGTFVHEDTCTEWPAAE
jgi:hypothetical protein